MGNLLNTLFRTVLLDDSAYLDWRESPNLFLRGILLILVVSLITSLVAFGRDLATFVKPADMVASEIEAGFDAALEAMQTFMFDMPFWSPDAVDRQEMEKAMEMARDSMQASREMAIQIAKIDAPLPRGISGFLQALGRWLSGALASVSGWIFYGVLVLIFANLLGGGAKLPNFLGMVSLYVVPSLLGLVGAFLGLWTSITFLGPIFGLLAFVIGLVAFVWTIVVYVKAVSVATGLDTGKAVLAMIAPPIALFLLGLLIAFLWFIWIAILAGLS